MKPWFPAGFISDLEELLGRKVEVATMNALHWYIKIDYELIWRT